MIIEAGYSFALAGEFDEPPRLTASPCRGTLFLDVPLAFEGETGLADGGEHCVHA